MSSSMMRCGFVRPGGLLTGCLAMLWMCMAFSVVAEGDLVRIHEDFSKNPGWEGYQNRIVATDPPTVTQDFGWSATEHTGAGSGEIGGTFWRSLRKAYYAMPITPTTFDDPLEVTGMVTLMPNHKVGGMYFGWFNQERQRWRPWSSIVFRLGDYYDAAEVQIDYMASNWQACGMRTNTYVPADGKPHAFRFKYDPEAMIDTQWADPNMPKYLGGRTSEEEILKAAHEFEPDLTLEELQRRLWDAEAKGQAVYYHYGMVDKWYRRDPANHKGLITFQLDKERTQQLWMFQDHRELPVTMDRFGLFNFQLYGRHWEFYNNDSGQECEVYFGDLTVNGQSLDLSKDPGWEGYGNRVSFVDGDFHGRHDLGYSETNWSGDGIGEIGGTMWRNEIIDPLHGYYAVDVGELTLDDPLHFSGNLNFVDAGTDGDISFGYFNKEQRMKIFEGGNRAVTDLPKERRDIHLGFDQRAHSEIGSKMGLSIGGPTVVGFYFSTMAVAMDGSKARQNGPTIMPDESRHTFSFDYDPEANGGVGEIVFTLDGKATTCDLSPEVRRSGATFDRFGFWTLRQGGKWVTMYVDDLDYTARYPEGTRPAFQEETIVTVPYPEGGRFY